MKYIAIEGYEAVGKTTLMRKLWETYKDNERVVFVREPGGTEVAEKIRELMLSNDGEIDARTEFFLMQAARSNLFNNLVGPSLSEGKVIVSDRCFVSSLLLQASRYLSCLKASTQVPTDALAKAHGFFREMAGIIHHTNISYPKEIWYLSADKEVIQERLSKRSDNTSFDNTHNYDNYEIFLDDLPWFVFGKFHQVTNNNEEDFNVIFESVKSSIDNALTK